MWPKPWKVPSQWSKNWANNQNIIVVICASVHNGQESFKTEGVVRLSAKTDADFSHRINPFTDGTHNSSRGRRRKSSNFHQDNLFVMEWALCVKR